MQTLNWLILEWVLTQDCAEKAQERRDSRQVPSRRKPISFGSMDVDVSSGDGSLGPDSSGSEWWGTAICGFSQAWGMGSREGPTDVAWASSLRMDAQKYMDESATGMGIPSLT